MRENQYGNLQLGSVQGSQLKTLGITGKWTLGAERRRLGAMQWERKTNPFLWQLEK
jgi:hypothetical protein